MKIGQPFIVEVEEEVTLLQLVAQLLQQHGLSTPAYTGDDEYLGCVQPFLLDVSRYRALCETLAILLLLKYNPFQ